MTIYKIGRAGRKASVIVGDPSQHLQKQWIRGRFYEDQMLEYIAATYSGGQGTFVDVGSSVGNHTLFFALFCTSGPVISIEPVVKSLQLQRRIIELNDLADRVQFHNVALSDKPGRGRMERFGPPAFDGMHQLVDGDDVEVATLDSIVGQERVHLIKIDVEYHEIEVLTGAQATIARDRPVLFVECVDRVNFNTMTDMLVGEFGYRVGRKFNASATYEFLP